LPDDFCGAPHIFALPQKNKALQDCRLFQKAKFGKKKAQPRRVAPSFHQRRRFWRICADICKDAQREIIMAPLKGQRKHFLLLCNKFAGNYF
jgi:hypothetical protein